MPAEAVAAVNGHSGGSLEKRHIRRVTGQCTGLDVFTGPDDNPDRRQNSAARAENDHPEPT